MESETLASGDTTTNSAVCSPRKARNVLQKEYSDQKCEESDETNRKSLQNDEVTPQGIHDNEIKLKERIAQCRNIIDSLKIELREEKNKLEMDRKTAEQTQSSFSFPNSSTTNLFEDTLALNYSACVESKLNCDENIIEYEKQLQKYQNTLNMAQIEKKNAIRKQMLAKAYKLKLLEVENQCNIELLRVKQSLQCLEPLHMIAKKWNTDENDIDDYSHFDLIPRFPELNENSGSDIASNVGSPKGDKITDDVIEKTDLVTKIDSSSSSS